MVTSVPCEEGACKEKCKAVCHLAVDMRRSIADYCLDHPDRPLDMRIGINVGPVVAGIVGTKRFLYDIWGDA